MPTALIVVLRAIGLICRGHRAVTMENLALREQLAALTRTGTRPHLRTRDRLFWIGLAEAWRDWRGAFHRIGPGGVKPNRWGEVGRACPADARPLPNPGTYHLTASLQGFSTYEESDLEIYAAPRSWAERAFPKLIHYNRLPKGGHFAAWEQPQLFSEEIRAAFRSLR